MSMMALHKAFHIRHCLIGRNSGILQSVNNLYQSTYSSSTRNGSTSDRKNILMYSGAVLAIAFGAGVSTYLQHARKEAECAKQIGEKDKYGCFIKALPVYRKEEISKHKTMEDKVWVTFRHGVYDITEWISRHPGGKKIMMAAGEDLNPFFKMYAVHYGSEALDIMEEMRIGNLHPDDMKAIEERDAGDTDPFANDPERHPFMRINTKKPFNAETPAELLWEHFNTPNDVFFVRNHLPVPMIDGKTHRLEISGEGITSPVILTIEDLQKKFKVYTISSTIQCAGNRRNDMGKIKPVRGLDWKNTAIGNAEWTGVKLADVLHHAGVTGEGIEHVISQGADKDMVGKTPYEVSIPIATAMDEKKDVLIAWEMNGQPIPRDHGYPLRLIVPGVVGARQVKWLNKLILSKTESTSHWQSDDYKTFNSCITWDNADFSKSKPIMEYPIQSAILEPAQGDVLDDDEVVTIKGYAWSGGGRGIIRVDVSIDGGQTWIDAELHSAPQPLHRQWAWTLYEAEITIPEEIQKGSRKLDIVVKATDSSHNVQPESAQSIWNFRGLINNAWHRISVSLRNDE